MLYNVEMNEGFIIPSDTRVLQKSEGSGLSMDVTPDPRRSSVVIFSLRLVPSSL